MNMWCRNVPKENGAHKNRSRSQSISVAELREFNKMVFMSMMSFRFKLFFYL